MYMVYYRLLQVTDVAADATAISPVMRSAIWSVISDPTLAVALLQQNLTGSAPCYNHHQINEPGDWAEEFWGANLPRLNEIKAAYDPERRLNCWHCVGFQDFVVGVDNVSNASSVSSSAGAQFHHAVQFLHVVLPSVLVFALISAFA
jgi:hypothetical protein